MTYGDSLRVSHSTAKNRTALATSRGHVSNSRVLVNSTIQNLHGIMNLLFYYTVNSVTEGTREVIVKNIGRHLESFGQYATYFWQTNFTTVPRVIKKT